MIDIENALFTRLATMLRTAHSGIKVYGEYVEIPADFPCVTIVEADNKVYERTRDLSGVEHYAQVMYEINVFTNDASGKKQSAKSIANLIDNEMTGMGFTRIFRGQTPNIDRTIYRITMRYEGLVREAQTNGDTTVFQLFTTR